MRKKILAIILILFLFPTSFSFAQKVDKEPTLGIVLTSFSPFNYKDADGYTIILGEIQNTKSFPISGVKIWAGFYDEFSEKPLETTIGSSILEVIPPFSKSPYMIKSPSANEKISSVSVNLLGFNSSPDKKKTLNFELGPLQITDRLSLSGTLKNTGNLNSSNTKIHLISYDAFTPPRVLGIATVSVPTDIAADGTYDFNFNVKHDSRAVLFKIVAESTNYLSNIIDVSATSKNILSKLVSIHDISIADMEGNTITEISTDVPVNIQSAVDIQFSGNQQSNSQSYVYWIQIKQSGEKAFVEFIGNAEGSFNSQEEQFPKVEWTPQNSGLYFIETFVWDPNTLPIASQGPILLVLVN